MTRNEIALTKIKEIYKEKRLTINEFSDIIGKSRSAWLRRETGEVELTLNEIDYIADKIDSDFGTLTHSSGNTQISNKGVVANSGINASITINITQEQLNKVIDLLK